MVMSSLLHSLKQETKKRKKSDMYKHELTFSSFLNKHTAKLWVEEHIETFDQDECLKLDQGIGYAFLLSPLAGWKCITGISSTILGILSRSQESLARDFRQYPSARSTLPYVQFFPQRVSASIRTRCCEQVWSVSLN
jgi:hypothetical protein